MDILKQIQKTKDLFKSALKYSPDEIKDEVTRYFLANPPKNDDELHTFISVALGINIPRYPVCSNHSAVLIL